MSEQGRNEDVASAAQTYAPNMIGDFFGSIGSIATVLEGRTTFTVPLGSGNSFPRFKMAENTSPLPQDRVYFDYDDYHNVPLSDPAIDVNAFAPGFEKTFFDEAMSFELRTPFANTLDNNNIVGGATPTSRFQFGDLGMALKALVLENDKLAVSAGLAMTVPTGPDERIFYSPGGGNPDLVIKNGSVHLMPFVGLLWTPNERFFTIDYLQVDVDVNGDQISAANFAGATIRDQTFMYLDMSFGYWVYRSWRQNCCLTGLAPIFEVHVNQSLEKSDVVALPNNITIGGDSNGNPIASISVVDLTFGVTAELRRSTMITAAYCTPVSSERQFDGQFRFLLNYRF